MKPREVVTRAIEFRQPPRMPASGFEDDSDVVLVEYDFLRPPQAGDDESLDQWLCRWDHTDEDNIGQIKGHPLADLAAMKDFPWPDGADPRRFANVPARLDEIAADPLRRDKYVAFGLYFLLWERMHSLRGFAECMMDLMDDSPQIHEIADRILEYDIAVVRGMHAVAGDRIQGVVSTDDWGTQLDLHISPELWQRFFQPRYKKLFDVVHECGYHMWMHSCGKINKIIPGLIEAGLDVINMQQPLTNGIDEIGRDFAGKICFETLCDIQKTLPGGDRNEIEVQAAQLLGSWGTPEGGFVLGDYGHEAAIGTEAGTREFMLETFRRLDPWK